jgi:hypothetical protein
MRNGVLLENIEMSILLCILRIQFDGLQSNLAVSRYKEEMRCNPIRGTEIMDIYDLSDLHKDNICLLGQLHEFIFKIRWIFHLFFLVDWTIYNVFDGLEFRPEIDYYYTETVRGFF